VVLNLVSRRGDPSAVVRRFLSLVRRGISLLPTILDPAKTYIASWPYPSRRRRAPGLPPVLLLPFGPGGLLMRFPIAPGKVLRCSRDKEMDGIRKAFTAALQATETALDLIEITLKS
jgi:hypothetical protein